MKIEKNDQNIQLMLTHYVFKMREIPEEIYPAAEPGFIEINLLVNTIIENGLNDFVLRLDDVCEQIDIILETAEKDRRALEGVLDDGNYQKLDRQVMRREIKDTIQIAHSFYLGEYDPPEILEPEVLIYRAVAALIMELGKFEKDIDRFVVRSNIGKIFDISQIKTVNDLACFRTLIDYFEHCLQYNERTPITNFIKGYGGNLVSQQRLMTFIKRADWYYDENQFNAIFNDVYRFAPGLGYIAKIIYNRFKELKIEAEEKHFEQQKSFD